MSLRHCTKSRSKITKTKLKVDLHDGSRLRLKKIDPSHDPTDKSAAYRH
ncbi:MAG: hypothetical protein R2856_05000 [Caldilineaceae bacterium]